MKKIQIFDSTLRDGAQAEGISFSVGDKIKIAKALHPATHRRLSHRSDQQSDGYCRKHSQVAFEKRKR